ncbi:LysR substrate-binding domain-containing protein [Pseudomonas fluorescens]|uniref:LysR family transcriptional regulator n=1 Tax=Pseudomonas fluorescens TaxID=294 RepID=UPI00177CC051|nr:LysR substrate-binding domain-containing protein [Pseudomonas fluorescens]MBD8235846.1 LysR family transcriptional regulator [Pseudomonas fluorescens]MDY0894938.1 LysR substrate-binding domain-containing protein [Pseudomonas fluorescens]
MNTIDLEIDLLRCFVAVAECKSFTGAGARLHRTQSAISVRIQRLEQLLGHRLLDRTSRSVEVTPHGEKLQFYARRLLSLNDETVSALCWPELSGNLRIGVAEYLTPHRLPMIVAELRESHPRILLEIKLALSGELLSALDEGLLDVVIAKRDSQRSGGDPLFREQLHWVSSKTATDMASGKPLQLCLHPAPCAYRTAAISSLKDCGREWVEVLSATSIYGIQLAVESGLGISVLGTSAITSNMTVIDNLAGLPTLQEIEIAIYGSTSGNKHLVSPFIKQLRHECVMPSQ